MIETVENILLVTTFIAAGGTVALIFFFLFAHSSTRTLHKQIGKLIEQNQRMLELMQKNMKRKDSNSH